MILDRKQTERSSKVICANQGPLLFATCQAGTPMALQVSRAYRNQFCQNPQKDQPSVLQDIDFRFSDRETCVRLEEDVNGRDVFLFQALQDPAHDGNVNENYLAFLIALRAMKEWGANRVTGVLPYLAFSRQDKPTDHKREPTTVELMADLSIEAGMDRLIVWAPHNRQIHGFYGKTPVEALNPMGFFAHCFEKYHNKKNVIGVAPDAGASKLMIAFCREMDISCAIASKYRPEPEKTEVTEIMGDFGDKDTAIILDDMINTGGTLAAVTRKLVREKGIQQVSVGVSHYLCSAQALERLNSLAADFGLKEIIMTDSIPLTRDVLDLPFTRVKSIAAPLARAIHRIHTNQFRPSVAV